MNPWHDISWGDSLETVNSIIEIPKGACAKYELDKESGLLKLDRILYSAVHFPANYGLIPQTLAEDSDPLDIIVISEIPFVPMCVVKATVIGSMQMIDQGAHDDKIIAVATDDQNVNYAKDISDLPQHFLDKLKNFFEEYKKLEKKAVTVNCFQNKKEALRIIEQCIARYNDTFGT